MITKSIVVGTLLLNNTAMVWLAQTASSPESMIVGLLSGTGMSGFLVWFLASRVAKKLDEVAPAIQSSHQHIQNEVQLQRQQMSAEMSKFREKLLLQMSHISELLTQVVLLSDLASEKTKQRAVQILEESRSKKDTDT